jgi:class 3 adenylate cyclase
VVACFVLLSEAMIGVALTGERQWHANWWEWHVLIVTAYLIVGLAARREWRDERFRRLYLPSTRERHQDVSVLFADLVGYTSFAERTSPAEAAAVLDSYWGEAAPLITRFRLESLAPAGGVLIGAQTYKQCRTGQWSRRGAGLRMKGKDDAIDAYLLLALPERQAPLTRERP